MRNIRFTLVLILLMLSSTLFAAPGSVTDAQKKAVEQAVSKLSKQVGQDLKVTKIEPSPVPGLLQVTADLTIFYVSADGKYMLFGDLVNVNKDRKNWSMTEQGMKIVRKEALAQVDPSNMIIYPATGKKIAMVTVFTDIECQYCRKMQEHISDYNSKGIEIRYLSFPRAGPKSNSYAEAIDVWCASNKTEAYTKAVEGTLAPKNQCPTNAVALGFELGRKLGVTGTPTIFLENGTKVPGYLEPDALVDLIKQQN